MSEQTIHESEYDGRPNNFHVVKRGDTLRVDLTYPPRSDEDNTNNQCRRIQVNQESVRASDGVRLHYDYDRDGFVVEQPKLTLRKTGPNRYTDDEEWKETGFFPSWRFNQREDSGALKEEYARADAEWAARQT